MTSLGADAYANTLHSTNLDVPYASNGKPVGGDITFADNGTALTPSGMYIVDTTGGSTSMTLGAGKTRGDVVELIYGHSGGNTFSLLVDKLHSGSPKTIAMGSASGQYLKLVWAGAAAYTAGWCIMARESPSNATATSVADLPAITG